MISILFALAENKSDTQRSSMAPSKCNRLYYATTLHKQRNTMSDYVLVQAMRYRFPFTKWHAYLVIQK